MLFESWALSQRQLYTGSEAHLKKLTDMTGSMRGQQAVFRTKQTFCKKFGLQYIEPELREGYDEIELAAQDRLAQARHAEKQQKGTPGARSTVGSLTTISNFMRMLYSRAGTYPAHQPMLYAEDFSPNTPQGPARNVMGSGVNTP